MRVFDNGTIEVLFDRQGLFLEAWNNNRGEKIGTMSLVPQGSILLTEGDLMVSGDVLRGALRIVAKETEKDICEIIAFAR